MLLTLVVGLLGCGSGASRLPSAVAVEVAGHTVAKAAVAHWIAFDAVLSLGRDPSQPLRAGMVPDPPRYTACVAYLQASTANSSTTSPSQLRAECRQRYDTVRRSTIEELINNVWLEAEAAARGVTVSASEVQHAFAEFKHERYPSEAAFQKFLKNTGGQASDVVAHERSDLLSSKLIQKLAHHDGTSATFDLGAVLPKRWAAKTNCAPGYMVPGCEQYKAPPQPRAG